MMAELLIEQEVRAMKKRIDALEQSTTAIKARNAEIFAVMVKEFPKYFAADTALGIATDGEKLGDEPLPDIHPIDLRSEAEKERGEAFQLTDFVDMDAVG